MRFIIAVSVATLGLASAVRPATLPASYADAIACRDFVRLLAEINGQFDIPPLALVEPETIYPEIAGEAGAQGTVKLVIYIDEAGNVRDAVVADSPGWLALEEAARRAAFSIRYRPAERGDEPVAAWYVADIIFLVQGPADKP